LRGRGRRIRGRFNLQPASRVPFLEKLVQQKGRLLKSWVLGPGLPWGQKTDNPLAKRGGGDKTSPPKTGAPGGQKNLRGKKKKRPEKKGTDQKKTGGGGQKNKTVSRLGSKNQKKKQEQQDLEGVFLADSQKGWQRRGGRKLRKPREECLKKQRVFADPLPYQLVPRGQYNFWQLWSAGKSLALGGEHLKKPSQGCGRGGVVTATNLKTTYWEAGDGEFWEKTPRDCPGATGQGSPQITTEVTFPGIQRGGHEKRGFIFRRDNKKGPKKKTVGGAGFHLLGGT